MKKNTFGMREIIILLVIAISAWSVWPSIKVHTLQGDEQKAFVKENPKVAARSINFGLDLAGGTSITLAIDKSGLKEGENVKDIQEESLEIIRNRVDQYGLSEPQISPVGDDRIQVELAGVDDSTAKNLVGSTAKLEFKILTDAERFVQVVKNVDNYLTRQTAEVAAAKPAADSAAPAADAATPAAPAAETAKISDDELLQTAEVAPVKDSAAPAAETAKAETKAEPASEVGKALSAYYVKGVQNGGFIAEEDVEKVKKLLSLDGVKKQIPRDVHFVLGSGFETMEGSVNKGKRLYLLKKRAEMEGDDIIDARAHIAGEGMSAGQAIVDLKFGGIGPKKFSAVTAANVGKQMAIVLDNQVVSAPRINERIPNGSAQISGLDDLKEANRLAVILKAGALKAPMNIIASNSVGATLGRENIVYGFGSGAIGLLLCLVFMVAYYRLGGFIASLGMIINTLVTAAVMSVFNATLTLPGIAGFILVLGMSLDANVIIYERIREEIKAGLTARAAVAKGYERAFSAIFDSNLTTVLTALILYKIGTGSVKGFGLTLMIGIITSLFCALTVTRACFDLKLAKHDATSLSIGGGFKSLNNANLSIVPNRGKFGILSFLLIVGSIASIVVKGFDFSIDFTGGQVYTYSFEKNNVPAVDDITKALAEQNIVGVKVRSFQNAVDLQNTDSARFSYQISLRSSDVMKSAESISGKTGANLTEAEADTILANSLKAFMPTKFAGARSEGNAGVGPTIGKELRNDAILAIILAWLAIGLYVWFRFGKLGLGFGIGAVVGLVHDSIITLGFISALGLSFDGALIAALLTMIGYSVNDTIVVFDRVRENTALRGLSGFESTLNSSINQCFSRTVITSLTTLFVCLVLSIMGGASIRDFGMVMVFGVLIGTYSSVCVCSPFVLWYSKHFKGGV